MPLARLKSAFLFGKSVCRKILADTTLPRVLLATICKRPHSKTPHHTRVDQNPMPLFTLQVVSRNSCTGGISDIGFNPQRVPVCFDHTYSSANALHLEEWAMLFFRQRILLTLQDHDKHFRYGIKF